LDLLDTVQNETKRDEFGFFPKHNALYQILTTTPPALVPFSKAGIRTGEFYRDPGFSNRIRGIRVYSCFSVSGKNRNFPEPGQHLLTGLAL
jgi:hypothetical protein